jgi:glucose-1-phosphatase
MTVDVVLFDLGGVLVDFAGFGSMAEVAAIDSHDEVLHRWITSPWVRAFERGACRPEEFAAGMVDEWRLPLTEAEFIAAFRGWLGDMLPGAADLVEQTRQRVRTGYLSNCNAIHSELHADLYPALRELDFALVSHELGMVKPDRELFDRVAQLVDAPAERVLLLDDNPANVDGARTAGFQAVRTLGVADARRALEGAGVLSTTTCPFTR